MFLSHTTEPSDLPPDRSFVAAAKRAVTAAGDAIVEMDAFGPSGHDPATTSVSMVELADVYVGIIGLRWGSPVPEEPDLSYTELEFRAATELGMERLIFFVDEPQEDVPGADGPDERQLAFRDRLLNSGLTVSRVRSPDELATQLVRALYYLPDLTALPGELSGRALAYARRDLLRRVRLLVVEQERSLGDLAPISLGLVERPSAAYQPHIPLVLRRRDQPDRPLPREVSIGTLFDDLGGQLLVLGEPGAGKTHLLVELAGELLKRAARSRSERMPVVLHLSTWVAARRRRSLEDWLVAELRTSYGVSVTLSRFWVEQGMLVPLLDGLDELAPGARDACVAAINEFLDHPGQALAVCSRTAEFTGLRTGLQVGAAVAILPLDRAEVQSYLRAAGSPLDGLHNVLVCDEAVGELLTTPLLLNVVAVAYRDRPLDELAAGATVDELRATMLGAYTRRMLERVAFEPHAARDAAALLAWLQRLATAMTARAETVFVLDLLQPDWLPSAARRRTVTIGVSAAIGMLVALVTAVVIGIGGGSPLAGGYMLAAALVGLAVAVASHRSVIEPTVEIGWSWWNLRRSLPGLLGSSLTVGAVLGAVLGLVAAGMTMLGFGADLNSAFRWPPLELALLVTAGFASVCAGAGLAVGLTAGVSERYAVEPLAAGRAVRASLRNWWVSTLVLGLPAAVLFVLAIAGEGATGIAAYHGYTARQPAPTADVLLASLAANALGGVVVGLIGRVALPVGQRPRPGRALLIGVAAAAVLGPTQLVASHVLGTLGSATLNPYEPQVPYWMTALALGVLVVALGGTARLGALVGLVVTAVVIILLLSGPLTLFTLPPAPAFIAFATAVAFGIGLRRGGSAFIRHWVLRWWLARDGLVPLDVVALLELATRLGLLRRRGGGYQFFHQLLQEQFARQSGQPT